VALWSAAKGVSGLIRATNIAYDEEDSRGWVKGRALALLLTVGAIVFVVTAVVVVAVVPAVLDVIGLDTAARAAAEAARWGLLVVAVMVALAVVYRMAPARSAPRTRWVSVGAVAATAAWIAASWRSRCSWITSAGSPHLWEPRRRRRVAAVALRQCVYCAARRGDQRGSRAPDGAGQHPR
jgi:uncharacterized BrkB/YihY/UPF0761 family membrane protein